MERCLGLVVALRALCGEFNGYHNIEVALIAENVPRTIPKEVVLCLFRVAQEALQNVKKHSGAEKVEVRVEGLNKRIHLSVCDKGQGFDPRDASSQMGIGIQSMQERLRLVNGHFAIQSRPMGGTIVDVWVPI